jgi:ABC-type uncharacterized transport system permease subunit
VRSSDIRRVLEAAPLLLSLIAVVCYLIGAAWLGFSAYRSTSHAGHGGRIGALAVAALGACIHIAAMLGERRLEPDAAMSLGDTAAMIGFVIGLIGIGLALRPRGLGIAALLIAVAAFLEAGFTTGPRHFAVGRPGWELAFHVAVATTAFALLTIGAVLAVLQCCRCSSPGGCAAAGRSARSGSSRRSNRSSPDASRRSSRASRCSRSRS